MSKSTDSTRRDDHKATERAERERRLAKALRDNLRRRRQQRQERSGPKDGSEPTG